MHQAKGDEAESRPPPGGVDRNPIHKVAGDIMDDVAPHPGAWIETRLWTR